jgi:hypothetical protein
MNLNTNLHFLKNFSLQKHIINLFLFAVAIFFLLIPSLANGYPILFSDVGTYIASGFKPFVPIDRPISYGLFVRHISMAHSLWFVVIAQACLTYYIIFMMVKYVFAFRERHYLFSTILVVLLSVLTGVGYVVNHLIPDIFAFFMLISFALLLVQYRISILNQVILSVIFIFSIITHNSHLLISLAVVLAIIVLQLIRLIKVNRSRFIFVTLLVACSWIVLPTINKLYGYDFKASRIKNIFFTGNLISEGLFQEFLKEKCASDTTYPFCSEINLIPGQVADFLWVYDNNLLYSGECMEKSWQTCWLEKDKLFGSVNRDLLTTPRYFGKFAWLGIKKTFIQLCSFQLVSRAPERESSPAYLQVKSKFKNEIEQYRLSDQFLYPLNFDRQTIIQYISVIASLLFLLYYFFLFKSDMPAKKKNYTDFSVYVLVFIFANAAVCAVFSDVAGRYENRIIFAVPLIAFGIFIREFETVLKKFKDRR